MVWDPCNTWLNLLCVFYAVNEGFKKNSVKLENVYTKKDCLCVIGVNTAVFDKNR